MNKIKLKNRFASIWFPQLPLETILSKEPLLDSLPLVVSFSDGEEIICANELAKKLNIRPKMSTKEVMDIVLDSIYRNGDTVWKTPDDKEGKRGINDQFEGVVFPMDLATLCKSLTGTSCKGDRNNFSSLLIHQLKQSGINVEDLFRNNILQGVK